MSAAHPWAAMAEDSVHALRFLQTLRGEGGGHQLGAVLGRAVRSHLLLLPTHRPLQIYLDQ